MSGTLDYVYAVAREPLDGAVAAVRGIGDAPVRLVGGSGLVGIVSDVDRAEFEAKALGERLEDLAWLERTARAHHHVVDTVGRDHVVAPLALATVYFDDDRVRAVLESGRDAFAGVLERLAGRGEWGVKAWATSVAAGAGPERARSGTEYLRRRRQALRAAETSLDDATEVAERVHETARALAVEARRHRLQDAALTGRSEPMVLNGAYLVATPSAEEFVAAVSGWAGDDRIGVEITGPWVPYSFVQVALP